MHSTVTNARHILQDEQNTALPLLLLRLPRCCCCCGLCLSCCWCCPTALNVMVHGLWTLSIPPPSPSLSLSFVSRSLTVSLPHHGTHILKWKHKVNQVKCKNLTKCADVPHSTVACISAASTSTSLLLVYLSLACFARKRAQGPAKCNAESDLAIYRWASEDWHCDNPKHFII